MKALVQVIAEYGSRLQDPSATAQAAAASELRRIAQAEIPQRIVAYWRQAGEEDRSTSAFTPAELDQLSQSEREAVSANLYAAYGTTLLAVLLMGDHALYLQLGDGDILIVPKDGAEAFRPLPPDPRSFANETASLGAAAPQSSPRSPGAAEVGPWADFRTRLVPMAGDAPALIMLTTDGYVNAFVQDAGFRKAATDILAFVRQEGVDYVERHLREWLEESSRQGSGDDVTVALLVREDHSPIAAVGPFCSASDVNTGLADPGELEPPSASQPEVP